MKKMISMLLAMMLVATCALPAGAVDDEEAEDSPAPVTVNTAEELLEAIEAAEDGDTILIAGVCIPSRNPHFGSSEKQITLARADTLRPFLWKTRKFSTTRRDTTAFLALNGKF